MTTLSLPIYINGRTDLHPGGKVELTGAAGRTGSGTSRQPHSTHICSDGTMTDD